MKKGIAILVLFMLVLGIVGTALAIDSSDDYKAGYAYGQEIAKTKGVHTAQGFSGGILGTSHLATRDGAAVALVYCEGKSSDFKSGFIDGFDAGASNQYTKTLLITAGLVVAISLILLAIL